MTLKSKVITRESEATDGQGQIQVLEIFSGLHGEEGSQRNWPGVKTSDDALDYFFCVYAGH